MPFSYGYRSQKTAGKREFQNKSGLGAPLRCVSKYESNFLIGQIEPAIFSEPLQEAE